MQVSYPTALAAGLMSFLSPCILPLIPGYLSFLSGVSLAELAERDRPSGKVIFNALAFVMGFSLIFILLGASATAFGGFLLSRLSLMTKISGFLIVLLGLHVAGLTPIKLLYRERRLQLNAKPVGWLGSVAVGMAFAFGWTPCVGPILATILMLASTQGSVWNGVGLLVAYSLGLGIPFLLTALLAKPAFTLLNRMKTWMRWFEIGAGALLVGIGLLIATDNFTRLSQFPWFH